MHHGATPHPTRDLGHHGRHELHHTYHAHHQHHSTALALRQEHALALRQAYDYWQVSVGCRASWLLPHHGTTQHHTAAEPCAPARDDATNQSSKNQRAPAGAPQRSDKHQGHGAAGPQHGTPAAIKGPALPDHTQQAPRHNAHDVHHGADHGTRPRSLWTRHAHHQQHTATTRG